MWHTGIVVFGKEFYYGGGISYDLPQRTPLGKIPCSTNRLGAPTKSVNLGSTEIPEDMFMELLSDISPRFQPHSFHLFQNNSNTFTNECALLLLGEGIPNDILDVTKTVFST